MATTATYRTGHIGLNVTDLERSTRFYQDVFGLGVAKESRQEGQQFVFLTNGTSVMLTLWHQSDGSFATRRPGLHHLSFQVESLEQVRDAERTLRRLGVRIHHGGVVAHSEGADSAGVFFEDPDGIRLEIFAAAAGEHDAPYGSAPTCGFF
jgi:lactoylglutathione lyase